MSWWVAVAAAVCSSAIALLLTPQVRDFLPTEAKLMRFRPHVIIAAIAGLGAGVLAEDVLELLAFVATGIGCSLLFVVDIAVCRLPDRLVASTLIALVALLFGTALLNGHFSSWGRALLAGGVLLIGYFILAFIAPAGLGLGDVKFAAVVGVFLGWFGWQHVAIGTLLAFVLNGIVAVAVLLSRRGRANTQIPFGPWMMIGAALAVGILGH